MRKRTATIFIGLSFLMMSCNVDSSLIDLKKENDFLKSKIFDADPAYADGQDRLTVYIQLINSDNSPVVGFTPKAEIISGESVAIKECGPTINTGVAFCTLRSHLVGKRTLAISNVKQVTLQKSIEFIPPVPNKSRTGIVSGSVDTTATGGYKVKAAVSFAGKIRTQSTGGHTVYRMSEGVLLSD